ncbi:MAG: hypothetical protein CVV50_02410 [Spirochaetae bacterium HGW-Spirochaetae-6]|nr:MAG: hypothetical protein CVV50_02410 [Spirochaetae bacterium HGW-Spirochaetae-6]
MQYYTAQISDLTQLKNYQKTMEAELNLARRIQQKLLPEKTPYRPELKIAAYYQPMQAVGGDFYDFIEFPDTDCLGIFISDSSGHGVPAAFITSMVKSVLENSFTAHFFPGHLLKTINEKLLGKTDDGFLTAFYGLLNYHNGKFIFARGGHPYPILIRDGEISELQSSGSLLGMMEDVGVEEAEVELKRGDKLLLFTDGLLETTNPQGIEFEDEFQKILVEYKHLSVDLLLEVIKERLNEFSRKDSFDDDVCLIFLELTESGKSAEHL